MIMDIAVTYSTSANCLPNKTREIANHRGYTQTSTWTIPKNNKRSFRRELDLSIHISHHSGIAGFSFRIAIIETRRDEFIRIITPEFLVSLSINEIERDDSVFQDPVLSKEHLVFVRHLCDKSRKGEKT